MRPGGRENGFWKWLERLTLVVAIIGLGIWTGTTGAPALWQWWENRQFDRTVAMEEKGSARAIEPPAPKTNDLIGRLSIPRLHLNVIVREGADSATLGLSAGHIPGTALPGQTGNIAIAAHRDTLFRALAKIGTNDVIRLEDRNGNSAYYQVDATKIVRPTEMSVIQPHGSQELTLVTCYPFNYIGSAPERFIVRARPIAPESATLQNIAPSPVIRTSATLTQIAPPPLKVKPYPVTAIPYRPSVETKTWFTVDLHHSRQVADGVSLGVTDTDPKNQEVEGWLWLMPQRRTVWLRSQAVGEPLPLYDDESGKKREVVITKVTSTAVSGYLSN